MAQSKVKDILQVILSLSLLVFPDRIGIILVVGAEPNRTILLEGKYLGLGLVPPVVLIHAFTHRINAIFIRSFRSSI